MADDKAVAFHEAGHCIAAAAVNCGIYHVAIAPCSGSGRLGELSVAFSKNKISAASQRVMVCLAGNIAQHVAFPRSERGDGVDLRLAHDAAAYLASDPRRYLELMRARTRKLVVRHWRAVEIVAAMLLERRRLNDVDLHAMF